MDYEEFLEPSEDELNIQDRVFEVPINLEMYQKLKQQADELNQSIPQALDQILHQSLVHIP